MSRPKPILIAAAWLMLACAAHATSQEAIDCPSATIAERDLFPDLDRTRSPLEILASANDAARQSPRREDFVAARQIYRYTPGAIYELYANPGYVSAVLLEAGETLNDVAAGDTLRWAVTQTVAETESDARTLVLVKPKEQGLRTNIVLVTDRRTYLVEAVSQALDAYSAQIAWCYPQARPAESDADPVSSLYFEYRIRTVQGRKPIWLPLRVFDDGRRTWIEFSERVASGDAPPLFVITPEGAELVNFRMQGGRYVVDRIFDTAELRLGRRAPVVVRIDRGPAPPRKPRPGGRP